MGESLTDDYGAAPIDDASTINRGISVKMAIDEKHLMELCKQVAKEQDSKKLLELTQQIDKLIGEASEAREARMRVSPMQEAIDRRKASLLLPKHRPTARFSFSAGHAEQKRALLALLSFRRG